MAKIRQIRAENPDYGAYKIYLELQLNQERLKQLGSPKKSSLQTIEREEIRKDSKKKLMLDE